eukprot:1178936-Prorocentrum_minimum.AAC.1
MQFSRIQGNLQKCLQKPYNKPLPRTAGVEPRAAAHRLRALARLCVPAERAGGAAGETAEPEDVGQRVRDGGAQRGAGDGERGGPVRTPLQGRRRRRRRQPMSRKMWDSVCVMEVHNEEQ